MSYKPTTFSEKWPGPQPEDCDESEVTPPKPLESTCHCKGEMHDEGCPCTCTDHRSDPHCLKHSKLLESPQEIDFPHGIDCKCWICVSEIRSTLAHIDTIEPQIIKPELQVAEEKECYFPHCLCEPHKQCTDKLVHQPRPTPQAEQSASEGELFYDGRHYIFLQTEKGPTIFAEIRGNGAGLPMSANAQKLCNLWNAAKGTK